MAAEMIARIPIVGLGASAGGISALGTLFDGMPSDTGMAFVVILHLDPTHVSRLPEILGTHTSMAVVEATDGMPVEPDRVHVIPPNSKLSLNNGHFSLEPIDHPRALRRPVDYFFESLAHHNGQRAAAVLLSGSGSNGSAGIVRIREKDGLIVAQDPSTAEYSGMPSHAVATGLVDLVLPLKEIPQALVSYMGYGRALPTGRDWAQPAQEDVGEQHLPMLLTLLRLHTGHEFRCYKEPMVLRRVHRRMGLRQTSTLDAYLDLVRQEPNELNVLAREMLINVTGFLRDPEAWEALRTLAIAPLVAATKSDEVLRIWVPGCATGEEAYTVAMMVLEEAQNVQRPVQISLFATDPSKGALKIAREGIYPASAIEELPVSWVEKYFTRENDAFRVRSFLRDLLTFAPQNLLWDPPFSRLDLVSCRNVLIYLKPEFQSKVISLFHFALNPGGYMFLGSVETPVGQDGSFETLSKPRRIFRRSGQFRRDVVEFPLLGYAHPITTVAAVPGPGPARRADPVEIARSNLLDRFAPPTVMVDADGHILYVHGDTGPYLRHPEGEPSQNLLRYLRAGLPMAVKEIAENSRKTRKPCSGEGWCQCGTGSRRVMISAIPVGLGGSEMLLITFDQPNQAVDRSRAGADTGPATEPSGETEGLGPETDLEAAREQLRQTVRQLEASNEDLKASNEEIMSINEELKSTNEELESSKEEMQSLNEELNTVNAQLHSKVVELEIKSNDLNNLLNSTETPTLFLDRGLRIRWFTPDLNQLLDLTVGDIGRPLTHFARKYEDASFEDAAAEVLRTLVPAATEIPAEDDRWFLRRILPYKTENNRIDGVVVTFAEITNRRRYEHQLQDAKAVAEAIVDTVRAPLLILTPDQKVVSANEAFYEHFQVRSDVTEGRYLSELGNGQWSIPNLHHLITEVLPQEKDVDAFEVQHTFLDIGPRVMLVNATRLDAMDLILLSIEDVTERRS